MWLTLDIVQEDVLEEDDGVVTSDGRLEQGLGVGHSGAGNQLHSRNTLEVALQPLAVLSPQLPPHTPRTPDHNWHLQKQWAMIVRMGTHHHHEVHQ